MHISEFEKVTPSRRGSSSAPAYARFLFLVLAFLAMGGLAARAQIQPPPPAAVLNDISASETAKSGTQIVLTFDPLAPKFSLIDNDTDKPSIAFALSSRGLGAKYPSEFHELLRSMSIEQSGTVLILHFEGQSPVHLDAQATGGKIITLQFSKVSAPASQTSTATASGPLPTQVERDPANDGFEVVPLKYADVSEVVGLLTDGQTVKSNDVFTPHEPAFGSAGMGGTSFTPPPPPGPETSDDALAQSVNDAIGIDRRLNAIILKGSPELIARLKQKIAEIDVPVQSVILETMFVELDDTGARNIGLDLNNANNQIGVATFDTGSFIPAGFATGHGLSSAALQAAIYAQVQSGRGRIVSKPQISAQSGSTAKIITGDALPILTSIALSGVNGVSQQVQYVNVGVTLQIAPRVSDDGYVTSHVFCVVSSVTGYQQGYPTISQREAQTSATVHDGSTFVIGGLTEEDDMKTDSKLPGLGDIPGLNYLFDLDQDTKSKTELYIVVTPHIVRRGEKLNPPPDLAGSFSK